MPIPDYQTLMLPMLKWLQHGETRSFSQLVPPLATEFNLTDEERARKLPSGQQDMFRNRVHWASFYLLKAGLLERPQRGHVRLTQRGLDALKSGTAVNNQYLKQFAEFREFTAAGGEQPGPQPGPQPPIPTGEEQTPEEQIEAGYLRHRDGLASEVLARLRKCSPGFFEQVVVDLLVAMGYGGSRQDAGRAVGGSGDGGIDGIIKEDRLGLDAVYVQAKRWEASVGRPVVQAFAGSLEGHRARKGVLITTSDFTTDALDYVTRIEKRIVLVNGTQLADLLIEHGIGVTNIVAYTLKRIDSDYFDEDVE
jgi:restriction system protein